FCPARGSFAPGGSGIVYPQGDRLHAISVPQNVIGDLAGGTEGRGEHETNPVLLQNIRNAVARTGFGAAVRHQLEPKRSAVKIGSLPGVADVELKVVSSLDRQKICFAGRCCRRVFRGLWHRDGPGKEFSASACILSWGRLIGRGNVYGADRRSARGFWQPAPRDAKLSGI